MKTGSPISRGFTLVEILVVIVVVSIMGGIGYQVATGISESSKATKLKSDVETINRALDLYRSGGGDLSGLPVEGRSEAEVSTVLDRLKRSMSSQQAAGFHGLTGSYLDPRIEPDGTVTADGVARAYWNGSAFVIATSGAGIKQFRLNPDLAGTVSLETTRRTQSTEGATAGKWVWDYTEATADNVRAGAEVGVGTPGGASGGNGTATHLQQLASPVISPGGGSLRLISFPQAVTVSNPNPSGSSRLYVSSGGSFSEYAGAITADIGTMVSAIAISLDPSRYSNSTPASATYTAIPVTLSISFNNTPSSVTYAEAGGSMVGIGQSAPAAVVPSPITLSLNSAPEIPSAYLSNSYFEIRYSLDGTDPTSTGTVGPAFSGTFASPSITYDTGSWGSGSTFTVKAVAIQKNALFISSPVTSATLSMSPTPLPAPAILPVWTDFMPPYIELAAADGIYPAGYRLYYTLDGTEPFDGNGLPTATAQVYTSAVSVATTATTLTVKAGATGPSGAERWFLPGVSTTDYTQPLGAATSTPGAVVGSGNIDGVFTGSLILSNPAGEINFNSQGQIRNGNLYLPGTPKVIINPSPGTVVENGARFVAGAAIPRSVIGGAQFNLDGSQVIPATDTRQIVDLAGSTSPSNYTFRFNANSYLAGKVYRRADPPSIPTVTIPTGLTNMGSIDLKRNDPVATLLPGKYTSVSMGDSGNVVRLGIAGSTEPSVYLIENLNLNKGRVEILGPVVLTVPSGFTVGAAVFGNVSDPGLLQINVVAGGATVNSGGTLHARLVAPSSTVTINGNFSGSLIAKELKVNSNGVTFTLPPIVEG